MRSIPYGGHETALTSLLPFPDIAPYPAGAAAYAFDEAAYAYWWTQRLE